jgi:ornithine cyclodeaminase/alanine dehydrogenase-like protein (mu-crystallin family)
MCGLCGERAKSSARHRSGIAPIRGSARRTLRPLASCATLAEQPLIKGSWLKATSHLDLVGSFRPNMREADDECLRDAFIAVDTYGALNDSGDLIDPLARGVIAKDRISSLSELIAGIPTAPRPHKTVFKSVGVALADLAVAEQLYERNARGA